MPMFMAEPSLIRNLPPVSSGVEIVTSVVMFSLKLARSATTESVANQSSYVKD